VRSGALLSVLAVAMDPFAQQLVQYRQELDFVPTTPTKATIARGIRYYKGTELRQQIAGIKCKLALPPVDFAARS
jgi:hypothetical protein